MIGGQRFDYVGTKPARGEIGLDEERRRRLALLMSMLGANGPETALKSSGMTRDELVGILANGLGITEQEVLELLAALLGVGAPEEPEAALKARQELPEEPRRDRLGRRINKPHGKQGREEEDGGPRRDGQGYRRNKPHDPRKDGW